jgi:hypothetical protein
MMCPKHIAARKAGILIGSNGIFSPTFGSLIRKDIIRDKKQQLLIIIAVVGVHAGVTGAFVPIVNKMRKTKFKSPLWKIIQLIKL